MMAALKQIAGTIAQRAHHAEFEHDDARALALYRQSVAMPETGDFWPADFGGYVPASVITRLRLAGVEKRVDPAGAQQRYRALVTEADAALLASDSRYTTAAWHAARGLALAGLGQKAEAVAAGKRAMAMVPEGSDALEWAAWPSYLARIHAMNGEAKEAAALLRKEMAVVGGLDSVGVVRVDPVWDGVRADVGFRTLTR